MFYAINLCQKRNYVTSIVFLYVCISLATKYINSVCFSMTLIIATITFVSIIDLMGKEVYNSNSLTSMRIDISDLEIGNYIIVVNSDSGKKLGKLIKTK